jgi:1-acyl-sn-glycerol-3-phosphate acyltransferase
MFKETLKAVWYWLARWACRLFCMLFFRFRMYGTKNVPNNGAVIFASNHQSYLDPILCGVALKRHLCYVARDSLFENKLFALLIKSVNAIPVKRGTADIAAMRTVIGKLKEGKGVCLFPEATRTSDGRIAAFKPGFGLLCRRSEAMVVPVLLDGAFECWPRYKKIFSRGAITVFYGEVITPEQIKNMNDKKLAAMLTDRLRQMQKECRIRQGKKPYNY